MNSPQGSENHLSAGVSQQSGDRVPSHPSVPSEADNYSSAQTLTGRSRKRSGKACNRCQKRKIKCDGKFPCGHCTIAKANCEFSKATIKRGPKPGEMKKLREQLAESEKKEVLMSSGLLVTKNTMEGTVINRAAYSALFPERLTGLPREKLIIFACTYFDQTNLYLPMCSEWQFYMKNNTIMDNNENTSPNSMPIECILELAVLAMGARLTEEPEAAETLFGHAQAALTARFEAVHTVMVPALLLSGYYCYCTNQLDFAVLYYTRAHLLFDKVVVDEMTEMAGNVLSGMTKLLVGRGKLGKLYRRSVVMEGGLVDVDQIAEHDVVVEPAQAVVDTIETCGCLSWEDKHSDIVKFQLSLAPSTQNQLSSDPIAVSQDPASVGKALREIYTVISEVSTALHKCDAGELTAMEPHLRVRINFAELLLNTFRPCGSHLNSIQVLIYSLRSWIYRRLGCKTLALESADQALSAAIANRSYKAWCPYFHIVLQQVAASYKEAASIDKYMKVRSILMTILPKFAPISRPANLSNDAQPPFLPEGVIIDDAFLDTSGWDGVGHVNI